MKMTKQNKMLLGVGAIIIAGYFVWTNRKKSFANAGGRTGTGGTTGTYTLPAGSRCPKPYLTVQGITSNAPVTCVPPKTMTTTSGGVQIFSDPKDVVPPRPPQIPSTTPVPPQIPSTTPIPNVPGTPPGTFGNPKGFI